MIILSTNPGALNDTTNINLSNRLLTISSSHKKPDFLLIQEEGRNSTIENSPNLGYANIETSKTNITDTTNVNYNLSADEERGVRTFTIASATFPSELNIHHEITCSLDTLNYLRSTDSHRPCSLKICIINAYRNHKIPVRTFKNQIEGLLEAARVIGIEAFIVMGDMNSSSIHISRLIEIPHDGYHKHRSNSRPTKIDKVFVCQKIYEIGVRIMTLPTVESYDDKDLGHKCIVLFVNEKIQNSPEKVVIDKKKFMANLKRKFDDDCSSKLLAIINNPNNKSDKANVLMEVIEDVANKSKIKIKKKEPLQIEDLEIIQKDKNCIKNFCLFYNKIKESLLVESETLNLNQGLSRRPPVSKICQHLETKLNRGKEADEDAIEKFSNSLVSTRAMYTPCKPTHEELMKALPEITKTKTPWVNGLSPDLIIRSMQNSSNFAKLVKAVLDQSFKTGKLPPSMCQDLVIFLAKKGDLSDPANFRPICIDHPFTKIASQFINRKVIFQLKEFTSQYNYSYTPGKSTNQAILHLCNTVSEIRSRENYALVICTDMSGAFETIQQRLVSKLMDKKVNDSDLFKGKSWVNDYLLSKKLVARDENGTLIPVNRHLKTVGSGQGSKISPNLWLLQSGAAVFRLDYEKPTFLIAVNGEEMYQIIFADDNIATVEFLNEAVLLNVALIRIIANKFLKLWDSILDLNGMILNKTKTEILCKINQKKPYPPLKTTIKWLGIYLTMTKDGYIIADVTENLNNIRKKTLSKFTELMFLSTNIVVRLYVFHIFIEPVIDFCLIICILEGSKWEAVASKLQIIQNTFLRKIIQLGFMTNIEEMHENLGVKLIKWKLQRMAAGEWSKIPSKVTKNHKLSFTRSLRAEPTPIIKSSLDCLRVLASNFNKDKYSDLKFDIEKFEKWKKIKTSNYHTAQKHSARNSKRKILNDPAEVMQKMRRLYDF